MTGLDMLGGGRQLLNCGLFVCTNNIQSNLLVVPNPGRTDTDCMEIFDFVVNI
jgi:hypothetical protein